MDSGTAVAGERSRRARSMSHCNSVSTGHHHDGKPAWIGNRALVCMERARWRPPRASTKSPAASQVPGFLLGVQYRTRNGEMRRSLQRGRSNAQRGAAIGPHRGRATALLARFRCVGSGNPPGLGPGRRPFVRTALTRSVRLRVRSQAPTGEGSSPNGTPAALAQNQVPACRAGRRQFDSGMPRQTIQWWL